MSDPQPERPGAGVPERLRIEDELIGLDRDDPEVQAFADHLRRTQRQHPGYTVEGYLSGVGDFADSIRRTGGARRLAANALVLLLLLGAAFAVWEALAVVFATFLG
ncbi:MAG: hypothetical protein M3R63_24305 [Actinomycetota bacterium]|nr:hypothetical protein [Actinomycetota bacterium]